MNSVISLGTFGLRLSRSSLRVLRERGISAQSSVSLEHRHLAKRYVVRGVESGGAAGDIGHYVTFSQENGQPAQCFCPVETIGTNGPHAVILAPVLVRIEMLRKASTYELLIAQHRPSRAATVRVRNLSQRHCFAEFTGGWSWICQERTKHEPVRSYRLSVLGVEMRSAYRDVFCRRSARLRWRRIVWGAVTLITRRPAQATGTA